MRPTEQAGGGFGPLLPAGCFLQGVNVCACATSQGGELVAVVRGADAPLLQKTILDQLEAEKKVLAGGAARKVVTREGTAYGSPLTCTLPSPSVPLTSALPGPGRCSRSRPAAGRHPLPQRPVAPLSTSVPVPVSAFFHTVEAEAKPQYLKGWGQPWAPCGLWWRVSLG